MDRKSIVIAIRTHLEERLKELTSELRDLSEGNNDNLKSTAGDDHDTERAMLHQEMERLSDRADAERKILVDFDRLESLNLLNDEVGYGHIVRTDRGYFMLGIPFGKIVMYGMPLLGISMTSPMGMALKGRKRNEAFEVNQNTYTVLDFL